MGAETERTFAFPEITGIFRTLGLSGWRFVATEGCVYAQEEEEDQSWRCVLAQQAGVELSALSAFLCNEKVFVVVSSCRLNDQLESTTQSPSWFLSLFVLSRVSEPTRLELVPLCTTELSYVPIVVSHGVLNCDDPESETVLVASKDCRLHAYRIDKDNRLQPCPSSSVPCLSFPLIECAVAVSVRWMPLFAPSHTSWIRIIVVGCDDGTVFVRATLFERVEGQSHPLQFSRECVYATQVNSPITSVCMFSTCTSSSYRGPLPLRPSLELMDGEATKSSVHLVVGCAVGFAVLFANVCSGLEVGENHATELRELETICEPIVLPGSDELDAVLCVEACAPVLCPSHMRIDMEQEKDSVQIVIGTYSRKVVSYVVSSPSRIIMNWTMELSQPVHGVCGSPSKLTITTMYAVTTIACRSSPE